MTNLFNIGKSLGTSIFLFSLLVLTLSSVNAAVQPFQATSGTPPCEILNPYYEYLPQNQEFDFFWHVYNSTTLLTNETAQCSFHLYSKQDHGEHINVINNVINFGNGRDFFVDAPSSNFTKLGDYCYLIECGTPLSDQGSASAQVCGIERCFQVTTAGQNLNTNALFFMILILCSSSLLIFSFIFRNYIFSFVSGLLFMVAGVYSMIYGFTIFLSNYTRMISFIIIGIGVMITIASSINLIEELSIGNKKDEEY